MAADFIPARDADLLSWSANFSTRITAQPTLVGLVAAQASAYAALHTTFATDLAIARAPSTRTSDTVAAKGIAKTNLVAMARDLARIINAFPGTTIPQRLQLGLNPHTGTVTPIQPPDEAPVLEVVGANGRTLKARVHGLDAARRGKPAGVSGVSVFSYVGNAPPADMTEWVFQGSTSRTSFDVQFPPTVPAGSQVYLCAFWFNPRSQSGPACLPVAAYLAGGVVGSQQQAA